MTTEPQTYLTVSHFQYFIALCNIKYPFKSVYISYIYPQNSANTLLFVDARFVIAVGT